MPTSNNPHPDNTELESGESFDAIFQEYEQSHAHRAEAGGRQIESTVVAVSADSVYLDIGYKTEGVLPLAPFQSANEEVKPGDKFLVAVKGRNAEGYYELSRFKVEQPRDWSALERAFADKVPIAGTVTGVVKGGLTVDVGVRAFMPASRSGARDAAELEKLVGQQIRCRIIKLEVTEEDVVVDRRVLAEEEDRSTKERRYGELKEGETVHGEVRSLTGYGAFVNIGGVDALLHVGDIAWGRINKPEDVLSVGQQIEARVLKVDSEKQRISVGMKQLLPHPWDALAAKLKAGDRVHGTVTRVADFGAFVEIEPGVEGLIHLSEMSWAKKVRKASDVLKQGDTVEAVVLGVNMGERRLSLGLKQTLGDPWAEIEKKFPAGSAIEGPVSSFTKFGAFVQLADGIEGMVHVSEISADKHIHHPQDVLHLGQVVKVQVLEVDKAKRQLRLSMKQRTSVTVDEYLAEHPVGSLVTGRILEVAQGLARVELGEGIEGVCRIGTQDPGADAPLAEGKVDLSALSSMLKAHWKGGPSTGAAKPDAIGAGQIRSFRIAKMEADARKIDLELV
ncbi:MAG TPA: S1 RNA-binding domain-containing protein [Acidobacteriaceae bacterium]|nr:S1 RNA-binding domain-containing protein [Acidobacteriaceae bacterium]